MQEESDALGLVILLQHLYLQGRQTSQQVRMHGMFQLAGQLQQVLQRLTLACLQALAGAAPVGTDKTAHAQGDAAIPAADQNDQLVAGKVLNGGEYRSARTVGRFAIVAAA